MAINVSVANTQAGQLSGYANDLRSAKSQLNSYKTSVSTNWQGKEVPYILTGIDQAIAQIDSAIKQLESLSTDIKNTASTIKQEDDAAAAAARAKVLKEQNIRAAQTAYNNAVDELDSLNREKEKLESAIKKASITKKLSLLAQLAELNQKIEKAQQTCDKCRAALQAARR